MSTSIETSGTEADFDADAQAERIRQSRERDGKVQTFAAAEGNPDELYTEASLYAARQLLDGPSE